MPNPIRRLHRRLRTRELGPNTSMREPGDRTVWNTPPQNGPVSHLVRIDSLAAKCDRDSAAERWFCLMPTDDPGRYQIDPSGPEEWSLNGDYDGYLDMADAYGPLSRGDQQLVKEVFAQVDRLGGPKEWNR